jgi:hypothetical protein
VVVLGAVVVVVMSCSLRAPVRPFRAGSF